MLFPWLSLRTARSAVIISNHCQSVDWLCGKRLTRIKGLCCNRRKRAAQQVKAEEDSTAPENFGSMGPSCNRAADDAFSDLIIGSLNTELETLGGAAFMG